MFMSQKDVLASFWIDADVSWGCGDSWLFKPSWCFRMLFNVIINIILNGIYSFLSTIWWLPIWMSYQPLLIINFDFVMKLFFVILPCLVVSLELFLNPNFMFCLFYKPSLVIGFNCWSNSDSSWFCSFISWWCVGSIWMFFIKLRPVSEYIVVHCNWWVSWSLCWSSWCIWSTWSSFTTCCTWSTWSSWCSCSRMLLLPLLPSWCYSLSSINWRIQIHEVWI